MPEGGSPEHGFQYGAALVKDEHAREGKGSQKEGNVRVLVPSRMRIC